MDHSGAQLLEFSSEEKETIAIPMLQNRHERDGDKQDNESKLLHKEKNHLADYYKRIIAVIRNFDEIMLFGPTNVKSEFHNYLRKDPFFDKMAITIKTTDKISEEQKHQFVTDFFKRFDIRIH